MIHLILVRHGMSLWNENPSRFTGWVDINLGPVGKLEAVKSGELIGELIKEKKINLDYFFASFQKRSIDTLKLIINTLNLKIKDTQIIKAYQLNERHYGALTGLSKEEMKKKLGEETVHKFRRSWDVRPENLNRNSPFHPLNIEIYKDVPRENIPDTESLKDCYERVIPYFKKEIQSKLKDNKNILVSAHGNSIRAICKYLFDLSDTSIVSLEIVTGSPILLEFEENKLKNAKYLDKSRAKDLIAF